MNKVFTKEQVEKLNQFQQNPKYHPFTCKNDGDKKHMDYEFSKKETSLSFEEWCEEQKKLGINYPHMEFNQTCLIATEEGWVCPVCDYKQNWAHDFMMD